MEKLKESLKEKAREFAYHLFEELQESEEQRADLWNDGLREILKWNTYELDLTKEEEKELEEMMFEAFDEECFKLGIRYINGIYRR